MNDPEFENKLRGLRPAPPSLSLEGRIAAALPQRETARFSLSAWLGERLLWTAGGAVAAWMLLLQIGPAPIDQPEQPATQVASKPLVTEEPTAWLDGGVQLIGGNTPARLLHRQVIERRQSDDGTVMVQVPREDVILVPVKLH